MVTKAPEKSWAETLVDLNEPYIQVPVAPVLVMLALGLRIEAIVFALGAATFVVTFGTS